jgi:hypothetical protein
MAHQLEQMAYVGETPWHGLGNQLTPDQPIEVWASRQVWTGALNHLMSVTWHRMRKVRALLCLLKSNVLYRSDTHAPLSVVSQRFQEVQPSSILEFYRDLTEQSGFELKQQVYLKAVRSSGHWLRLGRPQP